MFRRAKQGNKLCPLVREPCLEHGCEFYRFVMGEDPQTGTTINDWDCIVALQPKLMVEFGRRLNESNAIMDKTRNELGKVLRVMAEKVMEQPQQSTLPPGVPRLGSKS